MKRNETEVEKDLIECGYSLSHKTYVGKHSEHVANYVYSKENEIILLDQKRKSVVNYGLANVNVDLLDDPTLNNLRIKLFNLKTFIKSMNFEQRDELCGENDNEQ